jgi:hypothetical protein
MTRWHVSAFSVVLIGQICRSCTSTTPVQPDRRLRTAAGSICGGTAAIEKVTDAVGRMRAGGGAKPSREGAGLAVRVRPSYK